MSSFYGYLSFSLFILRFNNSKNLKEAWAIRKTSRKPFTAHQSGIYSMQ
jgi:hypothetical protein